MPARNSTFFVTADGKFFPCERVDETSEELCIGDLQQGINIDNAIKILNVADVTSRQCIECWCYKMCYQCISKAQEDGRINAEARLKWCQQTRAGVEGTIKDYIILKNMGVNLRRLSMKYAVYPYTLDNLYLSKVSENLLKSDISYIVPGGKVSEVYNSSISMIYSMANIMSMQEVDFDKVIIVDSNMVSYEEYDNAIKVFFRKKYQDHLATGIYDEILYSKHSQKRIEICKGNEIVIDSIVHKNKQEIEVPIISVMGVGYNVSKFDVQLYLREMFLKKDIK